MLAAVAYLHSAFSPRERENAGALAESGMWWAACYRAVALPRCAPSLPSIRTVPFQSIPFLSTKEATKAERSRR